MLSNIELAEKTFVRTMDLTRRLHSYSKPMVQIENLQIQKLFLLYKYPDNVLAEII